LFLFFFGLALGSRDVREIISNLKARANANATQVTVNQAETYFEGLCGFPPAHLQVLALGVSLDALQAQNKAILDSSSISISATDILGAIKPEYQTAAKPFLPTKPITSKEDLCKALDDVAKSLASQQNALLQIAGARQTGTSLSPKFSQVLTGKDDCMGSGDDCSSVSACCGDAYCWEYGGDTRYQCVNPTTCTPRAGDGWTGYGQCVRPAGRGVAYCSCPSPLVCTSGSLGQAYCTRACPPGPWTKSGDSTWCWSGWSTTWNDQTAKSACEGAGFQFPPLDYSNHPYTCNLTPAGPWNLAADGKSCWSSWSSSWDDTNARPACKKLGYTFPELDWSNHPYTCIMAT